MMKAVSAVFCLIWAVLLPAEIIREDASSLTFRQPDRVEVTITKKPRRTVVGYASLAGVWDLAGGSAIGVPDIRAKSALPDSMRKLPVIGSPTVPNVEKIIALKPDLVLLIAKLERHRAVAALLRNSGIPAVCVEYNNYNDFHKLLDLFCRINGNSVDAVPAARNVTRDIKRICSAAKDLKAPRCAIIFASSGGFSLESPRTNTGCVVSMLGARNIRKTEQPVRMHFSYEQFLLDNPEVVFVVTMGDAGGLKEKFRRDFMSRSAWKELAAAKNGRVHFLPVDLFLYMPGPRYPEAFRYLAKLLYPGKEF